MAGPHTLSRLLAARVAGLPDPLEPPPGADLPQAVIDAAVAALDAGKTNYTDRPGILPLRTFVTEQLQAHYGLDLTPDEVTITCGATEARFVAIKKLVPPGAQIVCPGDRAPIASAAHLVGAAIVSGADSPERVSAVYLTPADPPATRDPLLATAQARGWWIIWDTSGGMGGAFHPAQNRDLAPQVVTLGSFSNRLPGWRMGWMAGSRMAAQLRAYKQSMTICSTSISQWAALGLAEPS
jgi:aspartate/methionine/tyrosine aminotransferase